MGGKQSRTGKLVHLCVACIAVSLLGCAGVKQTCPPQPRAEVRKPQQCVPAPVRLGHAKKLLAQGDIEGVMKECQRYLSAGAGRGSDEALFLMALAQLHYKNPKPDYRQSAAIFNRLVREYPQSPLSDQALTWAGVLYVIEQSKQIDLDLEKLKQGTPR